MATKLTKSVTRVTPIISDNRTAPREQDYWNVTLVPAGAYEAQLTFRRKRSRTVYRVSLSSVLSRCLGAEIEPAKRKGRA